MIEFLKSNFQTGDLIEITTDSETIRGQIDFFGPDYIVLRLSNNQVKGISESSIRTFASVSNPPAEASEPAQPEEEREAPSAATPDQAPQIETEPAKPFTKYKPGDRVPLSILTERDPSLLNDWSKKGQTKKRNEEAVEGVREAYVQAKSNSRKEDQVVVSPTGKIVQLRPSYQFGFIDTTDQKRYYFNRSDLLDDTLRDFSGDNIEVAFLPGSNHKGLSAKAIVRPQTIDKLLDIVMELTSQGDLFRSRNLLNMIAEKHPKNQSTRSILEALESVLSKGRDQEDSDEDSQAYDEGIDHLEDKDFQAALKSFYTSIEEGVKVEQAIKQSITAYVRMYTATEDLETRETTRHAALDFINEKKSDLPNNISTLFVLENAYFALGEYSAHIDVVEEVINFCAKKRDIAKYLFYLRKAAQSYYRLGDYGRALDSAQEGLEREPEDEQLIKLRDMAQDELNIRLRK
ncbi:tetratricopeptide repeat protein [Porphyromonas bennonis]|uniref:tetratricopeptide repeat protein n=1 Tax=Porphyromonas bennonis TaxID=501496 RepID=UPI000366AF9E|nr:hypothetical protein [Porphyromonas bennonis]